MTTIYNHDKIQIWHPYTGLASNKKGLVPHDYMIGRGKIEIRADDKGDGQKGTREMDRREQGRWTEENKGEGQK